MQTFVGLKDHEYLRLFLLVALTQIYTSCLFLCYGSNKSLLFSVDQASSEMVSLFTIFFSVTSQKNCQEKMKLNYLT